MHPIKLEAFRRFALLPHKWMLTYIHYRTMQYCQKRGALRMSLPGAEVIETSGRIGQTHTCPQKDRIRHIVLSKGAK